MAPGEHFLLLTALALIPSDLALGVHTLIRLWIQLSEVLVLLQGPAGVHHHRIKV